MSAGLLIISHGGIGAAIPGTAAFMLNGCPLPTKLLPAPRDCNPEELAADVIEQVRAFDSGDGIVQIKNE